jgi:hypothetical protein
MKASYLRFKGLLGTVSLVTGLLAANFALFGWRSPDGFSYLLGDYARYACAYGGLAAIIFGAILMNDFFVLRASIASKRDNSRNATEWLIHARTEWQLAKDFKKYCSMGPELTQGDFFLETEEELEVVDQK